MIDGSSCSGMKFASSNSRLYYLTFTLILSDFIINLLFFLFSCISLFLVLFRLSATLPNLRRVHLFWPPGGERGPVLGGAPGRSEEHTSELQPQSNLVCRLLLEKNDSEVQTRSKPEVPGSPDGSGGNRGAPRSEPGDGGVLESEAFF